MVNNKDMLIVKNGVFLGIEEYVDKFDKYKYTAKVISEKAKVMQISVEVSLQAYGYT